MFCKHCGTQLDDSATFCKNCGEKAGGGQPAQPAATISPQQPVAPAYTPPYAAPAAKRTNGKRIAVIAAAVLVIAAAVACIVIFTGGKSGEPFDMLREGVQKVLDSEGFDFKLTMKTDYSREIIKGGVAFDLKKREMAAEMEREIAAPPFNDIANYYIYENMGLSESGEPGEYYYEDLSELIGPALDLLSDGSNGGSSFSESLKMLDDISGGEFSEVIRINKVDACMEELGRLFNDEKWLKDNLDSYEKKKSGNETEYLLECSSGSLLEAVYEVLAPALKVSEGDFEDMLDEIDGTDFEIRLTFTIGDGYLTDMELYMSVDGYPRTLEINFSNFEDPSLDMKKIEEIYQAAVGE